MLFGDTEILPSLRGAVRSQRRAAAAGPGAATRGQQTHADFTAALDTGSAGTARARPAAAHPQRHRAQRRTEKPRHVLQHSRRPLPSPRSRRPPRRHRQGTRRTRAPGPQAAGCGGGRRFSLPGPGSRFSAGKGPQRGPHSSPRAASPKSSGCSGAHSPLSDEMSFSFAQAGQRRHSSPRRCGGASGTLAPAASGHTEAVETALGRLRAAHRGHGLAPGEAPAGFHSSAARCARPGAPPRWRTWRLTLLPFAACRVSHR